jgi:hypothetical protein
MSAKEHMTRFALEPLRLKHRRHVDAADSPPMSETAFTHVLDRLLSEARQARLLYGGRITLALDRRAVDKSERPSRGHVGKRRPGAS